MIPLGAIDEEEAEYEVDAYETRKLPATTSDIEDHPDTAGDGDQYGQTVLDPVGGGGPGHVSPGDGYRRVKGTSLTLEGLKYDTRYQIRIRQVLPSLPLSCLPTWLLIPPLTPASLLPLLFPIFVPKCLPALWLETPWDSLLSPPKDPPPPWESVNPAWTRSVHLDAPGQRCCPSPGQPTLE